MFKYVLMGSAVCLWLASVASAVTLNLNQTYTNNTGQIASDFHWWFDPDSTVTGALMGSSASAGNTAFSLFGWQDHVVAGNYNNHAYTTAVELDYSMGIINPGGQATMWGQLINNNVNNITGFAVEWTNANGNDIGSANLPCSLGGVYGVTGPNQGYWNLHIDNPNATLTAQINNLQYSLSKFQLVGPSLASFTGPWTNGGTNILIPPEYTYSFQVPAPDASFYPVVDVADLHWQGDSDTSQLRFEVVPEPATVALLVLPAACLVLRRRPR
ncbi:MAG: PEP-CTERM sorting domain-containing protein [Tepidisphaeraceae bacterium]|jgi:hypothetical protein